MSTHRYGDLMANRRGDGIAYRECKTCAVRRRALEKINKNAHGPKAKFRVTQYACAPYFDWTTERPDCRKPRTFVAKNGVRFEDGFSIYHCDRPAKRLGNMSLRGPAAFTSVAYQCVKCFIDFLLVDTTNLNTPAQQAALNTEHDAVE